MIFITSATNAETFSGGIDYAGVEYFYDRNVYIENNANVSALNDSDIKINGPVFLYNDGNITGQIDTNGWNLFLYNSGVISGGITTENGGNVVQIIRSKSELTNICVVGTDSYIVKIDGYKNLDFNDIKDITASSFVIKNSSIVINSLQEWNNWGKEVEFEEGASLIIGASNSNTSGQTENSVSQESSSEQATDSTPENQITASENNQTETNQTVVQTNTVVQSNNETSGQTINNSSDQITDNVDNISTDTVANTTTNVSGIENLQIQVNDIDNLHAVQITQSGQEIMVDTERVTDYNLIFNNDTENNSSDVLEIIRNENPDDRLIRALDDAPDLAHINSIKRHSSRFNHKILLSATKVINKFSMFDTVEEDKDDVIGVKPVYIFSDTINNLGGRFYVGSNFDNLYLNLGFNFNRFSYKDNLNDFSGSSYGLDIKAKQKFNNFYLYGLGGFSIIKFNANYVTSDNSLKHNPIGNSVYGKFDAGYDFALDSDLTISPFVGMYYQHYGVTDVSDKGLDVHGGTDVKYSFNIDGIKYEYLLTGALMSHGDFYSGIKVGCWSVADAVGISFDAGIIKDDKDYNYKLSVNAKMSF